jgi:hypothetical protein
MALGVQFEGGIALPNSSKKIKTNVGDTKVTVEGYNKVDSRIQTLNTSGNCMNTET